jgi:hypothetical protein
VAGTVGPRPGSLIRNPVWPLGYAWRAFTAAELARAANELGFGEFDTSGFEDLLVVEAPYGTVVMTRRDLDRRLVGALGAERDLRHEAAGVPL